jgi:Cft2 family RNA processing exonuclease
LLWAPQATGNRMNGQLPGITDMNSLLFQDLDVAVLDGTLLHLSDETVQEESGLAQFIASVRAAVDQQHRVLITSSAIGRAQILMQAVAAARRDGRLPKDLRLYCSPKVKAAHQIYLSHGNTDRMEFSYGVWQEGQILKPGCVLLAESRCLFPDTIARKVYDRLYDKQDVTILVTGKAVEDSPLMHLLAHHKGLHDYKNKFPLDLSNIRASIVWIPFADHAQNHELVSLIERMPQSCRLWFLDGDGQPQPLAAVAQALLTPDAAFACRPLTVHRISGTARRPGKVVWMRGGSGITIDHLPELSLDHRPYTPQQGNENVIEFGGYRTLTLKQEGE